MAILNLLRKDHFFLGLVLGILAPLVGFLVFYLLKFFPLGQSIQSYLHLFREQRFLIPKVMSLSLLANALVFFGYTHYHKDETSRGVLLATLVYAVVIILFKL